LRSSTVPSYSAGVLSTLERYMSEPGIEQTEETAPLDEFSDTLRDEALDRGKALLVCGGFSCDPNPN
jgi:hypothetical protein